MAVMTADEMVSFVANAKNQGWGYVYSGQGELYTLALAQEWGKENRAGKNYDYYVNRCARWFGHIVVDCSGLIIQALRSKAPDYGDQTANTLMEESSIKGALSSIPENPGVCVWRKGHIGIYIGNKKVIEAGGTNIGVVVSGLSAPATDKPWTNWGMLAGVDYSALPQAPDVPAAPACWLGRIFKLADPYMSGDDVAQLQKALQDAGFPPGPIDGVFGPRTQAAVTGFQKKEGITADGAVGPQTTQALFGVWVTDCSGNPCCPWKESPLDSFSLGRLLKTYSPYIRGTDVQNVQYALEASGFPPGPSDGIYGPGTWNAVLAFQRANELQTDAIVGPKTTRALGGIWTGN